MICYKSNVMWPAPQARLHFFNAWALFSSDVFNCFFLKTLESLVSQEQAQISGPSTINYSKH